MADLLYVFKIFQKNIQSDNLTIMTLSTQLNWLREKLTRASKGSMLGGGWEIKLSSGVKRLEIDGASTATLKGIQLTENEGFDTRLRSRKREDFKALRLRIATQTLAFLDDRFAVDENVMKIIDPFMKLSETADIRAVTEVIASDLNHYDIESQYEDLKNLPELLNIDSTKLLLRLAASPEHADVFTVFARIIVATPHSADVERSISANNLMKTHGRTSMDIGTENKWLFIHFNMPPVWAWNPRKCLLEWINDRNRRNISSTVEESLFGEKKTTSQQFFKGVFAAASNSNSHSAWNANEYSEIEIDNEEDEIPQLAKKFKFSF